MNKNIKLSPSIMCADLANLENSMNELKMNGFDTLHIDLIDGRFSPSMPIGIETIKRMRGISDMKFDVHLMSTNNTFFIQEMISIGVDHITFHYETSRHLDYDIKFVKQNNTRVGVALNPATPLSVLNYVLPEIDMVCLMLINPGFASQKSEKQISYGVKKISDLSKLILAEQLHTQIQVDGRVSLEVIPDLICAGANNLVLGSTSIFREGYSIKENRECLEKIIAGGR